MSDSDSSFKKNLATGEELSSLDLRYATLVREVSERPTTLQLLRDQLAKVRNRVETKKKVTKTIWPKH